MASTEGLRGMGGSQFGHSWLLLVCTMYLAVAAFSSPATAGDVASTNGVLVESFESGLPVDWSTTGLWHVTDECAADVVGCSTSGWLYFGLSEQCDFATNDAESGAVLTPVIAIPSNAVSVTLTYCSRYNGERGASPDGFDSAWVQVDQDIVDDVSLRNQHMGDWQERTVDLTGYVGQDVALSWQFDSIDRINNRLLGWQIDEVRVMAVMPAAGLPTCAVSDVDCNGVTNTLDIVAVRAPSNFNRSMSGPEPPSNPRCDVDGNGVVNTLDVIAIRSAANEDSSTGPCVCE